MREILLPILFPLPILTKIPELILRRDLFRLNIPVNIAKRTKFLCYPSVPEQCQPGTWEEACQPPIQIPQFTHMFKMKEFSPCFALKDHPKSIPCHEKSFKLHIVPTDYCYTLTCEGIKLSLNTKSWF